MEHIINLIDPQQVDLSDQRRELAKLSFTNDTGVPQLIVVGDQNGGKNYTLEARSHFHLPLSEQFCARFHIKLILGHSLQEPCTVKVELNSSKQNSGKKLKQFCDGMTR